MCQRLERAHDLSTVLQMPGTEIFEATMLEGIWSATYPANRTATAVLYWVVESPRSTWMLAILADAMF